MRGGHAAGALTACLYAALMAVDRLMSFDRSGTTAEARLIKHDELLITELLKVERLERFYYMSCLRGWLAGLLIGIIGTSQPVAAASEPALGLKYQIPATVSRQAASALLEAYRFLAELPPADKPPCSDAEWDARYRQAQAAVGPMVESTVKQLGVQVTSDRIGGVMVLRVTSPAAKPDRRVLLYVHGGGYVLFSARTSLIIPSLVAVASGMDVISIDYTVAPHGSWRTATRQVVAVYKALLVAKVKPSAIGILGDSAGGGLAAGSVLKMRDEGLALPGALYLMSPWSDITSTGDTYETLSSVDPALDLASLSPGALAYARPEDQKNPYVSPVYGDYRFSFPPTLIQGGTREMFLSNFVRLYQAIRGGGHEAILDLYEGMPHVFQSLIPNAPETQTAIKRASAFLSEHLR